MVRSEGLRSYLYGFIPALGQIAQKDEFLVFLPGQERRELQAQLPENFELRGTEFGARVGRRLFWEQLVLPWRLRMWRTDVLFSPFDLTPLLFSPAVLGVRNPLPLLRKMGRVEKIGQTDQIGGNKFSARVHHALSWLSCRKARAVFYPSNYAARNLGDLMGVKTEKRSTIYHGVDRKIWSGRRNTESILNAYQVQGRRFFLFVSTLYRYKRPDLLVEAFYKIKHQKAVDGFRVVIVGRFRDAEFEREMRMKVSALHLEEAVRLVGNIPTHDVAALYQECLAMVLPTTMETFGQPFVEAMVAGAPILCADTEFAREICGEAAWFFKANDCESLASGMLRSITDSSGIAWLRGAGMAQSQRFSWTREAGETLALLKRVGTG